MWICFRHHIKGLLGWGLSVSSPTASRELPPRLIIISSTHHWWPSRIGFPSSHRNAICKGAGGKFLLWVYTSHEKCARWEVHTTAIANSALDVDSIIEGASWLYACLCCEAWLPTLQVLCCCIDGSVPDSVRCQQASSWPNVGQPEVSWLCEKCTQSELYDNRLKDASMLSSNHYRNLPPNPCLGHLSQLL